MLSRFARLWASMRFSGSPDFLGQYRFRGQRLRPAGLPRTIEMLMSFSFVHRTSAMRLRRLVADSLKRLVQPNHFAWPRCLSPENWCFCVENRVIFGFWGYFGSFLAILGRKTDTFSHFCGHVTPPRGRWSFWGYSSFVERYGSPSVGPSAGQP